MRALLALFLSGLCFLPLCVGAKSGSYRFTSDERDPMLPLIDQNGVILIAKQAGLGNLNLKGIIYSPALPLAVINDEVLAEGDMIEGYFIIEISEKSVILEKDNKGFTLKLEGQ